ncbi:SRA stem-loop-interacting RNA-binding protein, mitochondrial [Habropoda laboriosa]|uniref:SRA stem-loop-interacting RNA-binding protein, mitochondrial n=2 Tax=Habropoda laboriosa TaxID=597456 RepID=A0A0L7QWD2_9HYME|nr:SRA stem-loop-interacting RNA-binding protein, mitochondrial [Habropoda laboriosa]
MRYLISIRNIPWTISNLELEKYFSAFGNVKHAKVVFNKYGLSTGCGFVEYYDKLAMQNALKTSHVLEENKLFVVKHIEHFQEEAAKQFINRYTQEQEQYMPNDINNYMQIQSINITANYNKQQNSPSGSTLIKELLKSNTLLRKKG